MRAFYHRLAAREARAAESRYRAVDPAIAERFRQAVEDARQRIATSPESLYALDQHYRQIRVSRFPYTLIFRALSATEVMIVAVAHMRRKPTYWKRRR